MTSTLTSGRRLNTYRQDMISVLIALWLSAGGFIDGFAHRNLDTPETFFTPWHTVLYSGYLAAVGWMTWLVLRNRAKTSSLRTAIPFGYETSVIGLVVFGVGGLGDLVWHTIFGIEVSIEALLSPTHLALLTGALMYLSGPLRAWWGHSLDEPDGLRRFWPPLLALTLGAAEVGFFFQYADGFFTRLMEVPFVPGTGEGALTLVVGIMSILITTIILMGALVLLVRRWKPPFGAGLVMFGLFGLLMGGLNGYEFPTDLIPPLVGGMTADLLIRFLRPGSGGLGSIRWLAFVVPLVMWSTRMALFSVSSEINWPASVWTGLIVLAGLAGVGVSLLAFPAGSTLATSPHGVGLTRIGGDGRS